MPITLTIIADDENDYRRMLMRVAEPYLERLVEAGGFTDSEPEATEPPPPTVEATAPEPKKTGRPKGSTNKPKTTNGNGAEPQTEPREQNAYSDGLNKPSPNGALIELLSLAEQVQIITDAAHDQPDKFKPLLVPLRDKLGVQYVSKAVEKDRPVLQMFINEHGLAV
jgi:hypothetical protein